MGLNDSDFLGFNVKGTWSHGLQLMENLNLLKGANQLNTGVSLRRVLASWHYLKWNICILRCNLLTIIFSLIQGNSLLTQQGDHS